MAQKKLSLSRTDFPIVNSLDNLEVGRIYTTYNYEILKPLKGNRGKNDGYVPERVNQIKKWISDGIFMFDVEHVKVNLSGACIDGNNRKTALQEMNKPVNFIITAEPRFNSKNPSDILNAVSEFNSVNSSWFAKDSYLSAHMFGEKCALAIDKIQQHFVKNFNLPETMLTPSRLIALAKQDKNGLAGKAQPRREYCDNNTANIINSPEFYQQVEFIANVIKFVEKDNSSITEWFVIRCLMPEIWSEKLDLGVLYVKIKKRGFNNMPDVKMKGIKTRVNEILTVKNK